MSTRKTVMTSLVAVLCVLMAFSGCPTIASAEASLPLVTLSIMDTWDWIPEATSETYILKLWGDKFNVTFAPIQVAETDYEVKQSTMLASNQIPDIMRITNADIWKEYGPQGVFLNTTQAVADGKMPNLGALYARYPEAVQYAGDGACYAFPTYNWALNVDDFGKIILRKDMLEKAGYDVGDDAALDAAISTVDGLKTAMLAIYEQMNAGKEVKEPILANRRGLVKGFVFRPLCRYFGTDLSANINNNTGRYEFGPLYENYKAAVEFMNWMYEQGILHPAWLTMTEDEQSAFSKSGKYGVFFGPFAYSFYNLSKTNEQYAGADDYIVLPPEIDGQRARIRRGVLASFLDVANAASPNADRILAVMDYAYSDEGAEMLAFGEEGYAWEYDEDSPWNRRWILNFTNTYPVDKEGKPISDNQTQVRHLGIGMEPFSYMAPSDMWGIEDLEVYNDPDLDNFYPTKALIAKLAENDLWLDVQKDSLLFTQEEQEFILETQTALDTYIQEETSRFINGLRSLDTWDDFVENIMIMGGKELEDVYNAALDRVGA